MSLDIEKLRLNDEEIRHLPKRGYATHHYASMSKKYRGYMAENVGRAIAADAATAKALRGIMDWLERIGVDRGQGLQAALNDLRHALSKAGMERPK